MGFTLSGSESKLVKQLIKDKVISNDQVDKYSAIEYSQLTSLLWETEGVNQESLAKAIATLLHLSYIPGHELEAEKDVYPIFDKFHSESTPIIPIKKVGGVIYVAISNPFDIDLKERLELLINAPVELNVASPKAIRRALHESSRSANKLNSFSKNVVDGQSFDLKKTSDEHLNIDENSAPIVKLVNTLLREAVAKKASDIHIESNMETTVFRYRVDGVLRQAMEPLDKRYQPALISRIKVMSELDITERHIPQDGRFRLTIEHSPVDFRVSILPSLEHEDAVIRILDRRSIPDGDDGLKLTNLGLSKKTVSDLKDIISSPSGMIIVAGPTGSGKTTTLYAALNEIDKNETKIITIEDPIEYRLPGILQIPVNEKKRLTFSKGLRSILRHDPDRIMIGEIRDRETAEIAVQSSLTGHLLFTTVHANSVHDVINRFIHMGLKPEEIVPSLSCVISQRLLRKLCSACKQRKQPHRKDIDSMFMNVNDTSEWDVYAASGCMSCGGSGYSGRTVIAEIIKITPEIAKSLINGSAPDEIAAILKKRNAETLRECALNKIKEGTTSLDEVKRVIGHL